MNFYSNLLTLLMVVTFSLLCAADKPYNYYDKQVNHNGINYSTQQPQCDQGSNRCLSVHNSAKSYAIDVLNNGGTGTCDQKYTINKGTEIEQTIYSGDCFVNQPSKILVTCKSNDQDPNYQNGWIIINFNQDNAIFDTYNGAKARFKSSNVKSFLTHDRSNNPNPDVEAYCPTSGPE